MTGTRALWTGTEDQKTSLCKRQRRESNSQADANSSNLGAEDVPAVERLASNDGRVNPLKVDLRQ